LKKDDIFYTISLQPELRKGRSFFRAHSKMVLRLHGMEEVGVRFPVGPHADVAQWQSNPFVRERLEVQLLSSAQVYNESMNEQIPFDFEGDKKEIDPALAARIKAYRKKVGEQSENMSDEHIIEIIAISDRGEQAEKEMKKKDPTRHQERYGQDEMLK
jgi:hypothetical protein